MDFVLNPDGTVTPIETKTDSYGNLKPKGTSDPIAPSKLPNIATKATTSQKNKVKKTTVTTVSKKSGSIVSNTKQPTQKPIDATIEKPLSITKQDIEKFFVNRKAKHQIVTKEEYFQATILLKGDVLEYFKRRYEQYHDFCRNKNWKQKHSTSTGKKKDKQKKKTIKNSINKDGHNKSKNTIRDIATIINVDDSLSNSEVQYKSTGKRKPQAGYARDYFGRVQKRDLFNEDKNNEFKQSQNRQTNYDYSNYDKEDDHDSFYDSNSFD